MCQRCYDELPLIAPTPRSSASAGENEMSFEDRSILGQDCFRLVLSPFGAALQQLVNTLDEKTITKGGNSEKAQGQEAEAAEPAATKVKDQNSLDATDAKGAQGNNMAGGTDKSVGPSNIDELLTLATHDSNSNASASAAGGLN